MEEDERSALLEKLERETASRLHQESLISKLKEEQCVLRKKLAQAEGHIDKMRFGANVEIKKRYILSHETRQDITLQQNLQVQGATGEQDSPDFSPTEIGRVAHAATQVFDSAVDGIPQQAWRAPEGGLCMEDKSHECAESLSNASKSVSIGHHSRAGDECGSDRSGLLSPSDSPVLLSPNECLTPPYEPDSDRSFDDGFWFSNITPPSYDLDSSDNDDIFLARKAIQNESLAMSDMYRIFDYLEKMLKHGKTQFTEEAAGGDSGMKNKLVNEQVCILFPCHVFIEEATFLSFCAVSKRDCYKLIEC